MIIVPETFLDLARGSSPNAAAAEPGVAGVPILLGSDERHEFLRDMHIVE